MDANDMKLLGKRMPAEDLISRAEAIDALYHVDEYNGRSVEAIRNLPSAQPSLTQMDQELKPTCADYISRQVLDLWNRYKPTIAVDAIEYDGELKKLLGTNLAEVGTDCISRQAALDCFHDWIDKYGDIHTPDEMPEYMAIEALPSAQPTLYGYKIEHLAYIARVMEKEGVTADYAVRTFDDMSRAIKMIIDETQQKVEEALNGRLNQQTGGD